MNFEREINNMSDTSNTIDEINDDDLFQGLKDLLNGISIEDSKKESNNVEILDDSMLNITEEEFIKRAKRIIAEDALKNNIKQ
jgi:hypothetical protein